TERTRKVVRAFVVGTIASVTLGMERTGDGVAADATEPSSCCADVATADVATGDVATGDKTPRGDVARAPKPVREPSALTPRLRARGYNACFVPDPGFGAYSQWQRVG